MNPRIRFAAIVAAASLATFSLIACSDDDAEETAAAAGAAGTAAAGTGGSGGTAGTAGASAGGGAGEAGAAGAACKGTVKSAAGKCSEEMFCKYGLDAFLAVNDSIIMRATAMGIEADIGDTFVTLVNNPDPMKVPTFKKNLGIFLVNAYGGDPVAYKYEGSDMKTAHKGLKITSAQYDAFISKVVVPALIDNGVPMDDINNCFAAPVSDPAFKASIVDQ